MEEPLFKKILENMRNLSQQLKKLLNEIYDHRDLTVVNLKGVIDRRTNEVLKAAQEHASNPEPMVFKHDVEVKEFIDNPEVVDVKKLPRQTEIGNTGKIFQEQTNPYVQEYINTFGEQSNEMKKVYSDQGPTVFIPAVQEEELKKVV